MKTTNLLFKSVIGAAVLTLLFALANFFTGYSQDMANLLWGVLSNFLICLLLAYYIVHSNYSGFRLAIAVFLIYFLIGHFNILIEAYIFNVTDRQQTLTDILKGFIVVLIFSPIFVKVLDQTKVASSQKIVPLSIFSWIWRILTGNVLYLVFYIAAGLTLTFTYPEILEFYEGKIPEPALIFQTQLFLRGFIFIAVAVVILRSSTQSQLKKAVFIGLIFAILGGIAPLIQPNELMPYNVRLGHGFEVGISNFAYGFVLSYLLKQLPKTTGS